MARSTGSMLAVLGLKRSNPGLETAKPGFTGLQNRLQVCIP